MLVAVVSSRGQSTNLFNRTTYIFNHARDVGCIFIININFTSRTFFYDV
jgi:hypothetical protein